MHSYSLRIELKDNRHVLLNNIDEYTSGYIYFFVRHIDGKTMSYRRNEIKDVIRLLPNGMETMVNLRKPKK